MKGGKRGRRKKRRKEGENEGVDPSALDPFTLAFFPQYKSSE